MSDTYPGFANNVAKCCGREPMLRVRPRIVFTTEIAYVQFECAACKAKGGLGITEAEANWLWLYR